MRLSVAWARNAMVEGDWPEAIRRWEELLDQFGPASSWSAYRGLITAYGALDQPHIANAVAERARSLFPDSVPLLMSWAAVPMLEEDWNEAKRRWEAALLERGADVSWQPYRGLANCYEQLGDIPAAASVAETGWHHFGDSLEMGVTWAQVPMMQGDWPEAVSRIDLVTNRFGESVPWKVYLRLALAHGRQGDMGAAADALKCGMERFPQELTLVGHAAELSMAIQDWPGAIRHWNQILLRRLESSEELFSQQSFPRRGSEWSWYEADWQTIVQKWRRIDSELDFRPTPALYRALGLTLEKAGLPAEAMQILQRGAETFPEDDSIAFSLVESFLEMKQDQGIAIELSELDEQLDHHPLMARFCSGLSGQSTARSAPGSREPADNIAAACDRNLDRLAGFAPDPEAEGAELGSIHIIRVPYGSSIELQMKAGRYFSPTVIESRVRKISERDGWEEMTSPENLVLKRSREVSDEFGKRFFDPPLLPAETLADAVLFFVFHELCLYEPMKRLAADIAGEQDSAPVFIESPTDSFRYLDGYSFSHFDVLYLYFELRRLGVNVFLCRYYQGAPPKQVELSFVPGVRSLEPRGTVRKTGQTTRPGALIPAGIRSVRRVTAEVGDVLVYSSGSVVKEFAYDRSIGQEFPINPEGTIHPDFSGLPTFEFGLWDAAVLHGVPLRAGEGLETTATVEVSEVIGGDWMSWMNRVLHAYLAGISSNAYAEISAREIREAHICDHLFTDAVIFADAVKASGGRVVLWPHSANPVHVNERRVGSFDEVHAVTRAGAERWRERFKDVDVAHSPMMMLDPPTRNAPVDAELPLSVVVIGGRSTLRHTPILNRTLHEESYRRLFSGLERLQKQHDIDVFFKPRGHTGEHEMWLTEIVGEAAKWRRALEHPLRLSLPNMVFVSVSMGSSALIEGLSRGIPGMIVRDFPVRDYTTLDDNAFPTGPVDKMLELIASCAESQGYEKLLDREMSYYAIELEPD